MILIKHVEVISLILLQPQQGFLFYLKSQADHSILHELSVGVEGQK